jgi:hypothetical protein
MGAATNSTAATQALGSVITNDVLFHEPARRILQDGRRPGRHRVAPGQYIVAGVAA